MNLPPDEIGRLQARLILMDEMDERIASLAAPIEGVRAAASRLRNEIADLDQQITASPLRPMLADAQRVDALISGEQVRHVDKKDVEACAARSRHLAAERQQLAVDLAAVEARQGELNRPVVELRQQRTIAEREFIRALGDTVAAAYRRDAVEFVKGHVQPLLSVAFKTRELTGALPGWYDHVMHGLKVAWPDEDRPVPHGSVARHMHEVWPRVDGTLISGEPSWLPDIVEQLITSIRAHGAAPEAAEAATAA